MIVDDYVSLLLAGDQEACVAAAQAQALDLEGLHSVYVDLIEPAQYRVGEMWEAGEISVAGEHLATAINRYVASVCYSPLARASTGGPRGLVTCTPDEMHDLGPRMLADLLECDGWDIDFYGASMPARDLISATRERPPRFIGISTALVMHLGSVKRTISAIRGDLGQETPPIIVGGNAYRQGDELWREVGADLYAANASVAVAVLRPLKA